MSISEQVKELRELANSKEFEPHEPVTYGFYARIKSKLFKAADIIESLSAKLADMERPTEDCGGGWIECENKMPEIGKPVLVCDKQGNVCVRAITCEIKGKKYWSQDKYDVVAWQPLPEPYHEP